MVPINISPENAQSLAVTFGCPIGTLPFTYLGLPLSLSKPKVIDYLPLLMRIQKRLAGCSSFLSYAENLQLVKFVFTGLPIFYLGILDIPVTVMEQIIKFLKHYIWRKFGLEHRGSGICSHRIGPGL